MSRTKLSDARPLDQLGAVAEQASGLLKILANPDRLLLLCRLSESAASVGQLETELQIRQPTLSQQLGVLRQGGLVACDKQGKHVFYSLASADAAAIMTVLHERFCSLPGRQRRTSTSKPESQP